MPKIPIDYSKTVMYKIVCNDLDIKDVYVGNTTEFTKRKAEHKAGCCKENHKEYSKMLYQFIRENGGWDNFSMLEIEKFPCADGNEARARERYWFEELKATLNKVRPSITKEEKHEWKKEEIICECGGKSRRDKISTHYKSKKHQHYVLSKIEVD